MSELEFALSQIGGTAFETFAMNFLRSQEYDVHESGDKGRDGGWDARVEIAGRVGIAHVSVRDDWRNKLRDDAEKVENLEKNETEDYDIFVFVTNQHVSGEQELKMQSEIANDYGWTLKILHKNNILGELRESSPELAERHLDVGVGKGRDHLEEIESLREERLDKIQNREGDAKDLEDGPVAVLHVIPTTVFSKSNMVSSDFPSPTVLANSFPTNTQRRGKKSYSFERRGSGYAVLRNDGLYETAVSESLFFGVDRDELWLNSSIRQGSTGLDAGVIVAVRNALEDLRELGYSGTALASVSLLDAEKAQLTRPDIRTNTFYEPPMFEVERYSTEFATVDIRETEIIENVEPILSEVWRQFGYENGTTNIEDGQWNRHSWSVSGNVLIEEGER